MSYVKEYDESKKEAAYWDRIDREYEARIRYCANPDCKEDIDPEVDEFVKGTRDRIYCSEKCWKEHEGIE